MQTERRDEGESGREWKRKKNAMMCRRRERLARVLRFFLLLLFIAGFIASVRRGRRDRKKTAAAFSDFQNKFSKKARKENNGEPNRLELLFVCQRATRRQPTVQRVHGVQLFLISGEQEGPAAHYFYGNRNCRLRRSLLCIWYGVPHSVFFCSKDGNQSLNPSEKRFKPPRIRLTTFAEPLSERRATVSNRNWLQIGSHSLGREDCRQLKPATIDAHTAFRIFNFRRFYDSQQNI